MKLVAFRVTNFRSVDDSGWIDTDDVTALIGTNESGKTNLLVPLWKLRPAKDGEINPIADYPRKRYNEIRAMEQKPVFIEAKFELSDDLSKHIATLTDVPVESVRVAYVSRDFSGQYCVEFPNASVTREINKTELVASITSLLDEIQSIESPKSEQGFKDQVHSTLTSVKSMLEQLNSTQINRDVLDAVKMSLQRVDVDSASRKSLIAPRYSLVVDRVENMLAVVSVPHPDDNKDVCEEVVENLPAFVYYSNYGNLDSEIYLPHVIANMKRNDLGAREAARARTLKVLFEFVKLKPEEIQELGRDALSQPGHPDPSEDQIKAVAEKKKERDILLQSASTDLTHKFRSWWHQGEYRFRFQADGDHFRIWVSDDKRPEDIELEGRSTGLQWFLSFYLIFLVESMDSHKGAILLLDEPGLSLHPIAQQDLSSFFNNLSKTNQLLYTTHSPFMVDPDQLNRVKAVYTGENGTTLVSADLRASKTTNSRVKDPQSQSIYPVYAALGLSVSDTFLLGCQTIIVEGPSDQFYLTAIKNYLISKGLVKPARELVFIPAGGVKGIGAVVSIVTGAEERLPYVVVDSDIQGRELAQRLIKTLYTGSKNSVIEMESILTLHDAEIEDLIPTDFLGKVITRYLRGPELDFSDTLIQGKPIIPQVEAYASKYNLSLHQGWKVEIAKDVKVRLLQNPEVINSSASEVTIWQQLFERLVQDPSM
jgi:energy-coupling factor transporter ATP-binding protein EcfA2